MQPDWIPTGWTEIDPRLGIYEYSCWFGLIKLRIMNISGLPADNKKAYWYVYRNGRLAYDAEASVNRIMIYVTYHPLASEFLP